MGHYLLEKQFDKAYHTNQLPTEILTCLQQGAQHQRKITLADCVDDSGHLTYRNCLYVSEHQPLRLHLMH